MKALIVAVGAALAASLAVIWTQMPEVRRYLKVRGMS